MIIKYSVGNGTVLIIMIILIYLYLKNKYKYISIFMIIKYNSEKIKTQYKKNDINLNNDDDLFGYGQYVIIDG